MNKEQKIVTVSLVGIMVGLSTGAYIAFAQTVTDKYFYLGTSPVGVLDDFLYPSGDQISYDIIGYPPITIIIHKWNELSMVQKTQITVRLETMGYVSGEEIPQTLIGESR